MPTSTPKILALIPAYNESQRISTVITGTQEHLPVLVIDDGSKDDTATQAENSGAIVLCQIPNQGKGAALRAGFRQAIDEDYEAVITLDADGQHNPAEIPKFLDAYQAANADLIIGARNFDEMPLVRRLANSSGQKLFSWAVGQSVQDNQSGYRLISRRLLEVLLTSDEQGFEFEVEMIVTCVQQGFKLYWVPIQTIYAGESSHINPVEHATNFLRVVWQTRQTIQRPR
jgi:glycosyltransferase involved in cell wall biosynthesis